MKKLLFLLLFVGGCKNCDSQHLDNFIYTCLSTSNFSSVFPFLSCWEAIGEKEIYVFPRKIVGRTAFRTKLEAEAAIEKFNKTPKLLVWNKYVFCNLEEAKAEIEEFFEDDDSIRILIPCTRDLIPRHQPLTSVKKIMGKGVFEYKMHHPIGGKRPTVLGIYKYNYIGFVESDLSSRPKTVDRIILNVEKIKELVKSH